MQRYRRRHKFGGTFFFTLVTYDRQPFLTSELARKILRDAIATCRKDRPFRIDAFVLLPDHLHCLWRLPPGDTDYSTRWSTLKRHFTHDWLTRGGHEGIISSSRQHSRRRGVWQRRFWEHTIRDEQDYYRHVDYIHWNPVKHQLAQCAHQWPYSTFNHWLRRGRYRPDWHCQCHLPALPPPDLTDLDQCE